MNAGLNDRWLLVDVGQVLIGFDHGVIARRLVAECVPESRRSQALRTSIEKFILVGDGGPSPNSQIDRGLHDVAWLCRRVCDRFSVAIAPEVFEEIWTSIFAADVNADVVACVDALRADGVRIGICSNTNASHWEFLRRTHAEFRRTVDAAECFLSFRMGTGKGDAGYFARLAQMTGAAAADHVLLDDKPENCADAVAAGLRAVVFDPHDAATAVRAVQQAFGKE